MIVDSHMHFGTRDLFPKMKIDTIKKSMTKYRIDFGIVSSIDGAEFGHNLCDIEELYNQMDVNSQLINHINEVDNIKCLFWCRPNKEELDSELYNKIYKFIEKNKEKIVGLKFHPYHSNLKITDEKYKPYFKLAKELGIPVVIHSAKDELCSPNLIYKVAKNNPEINFVMVHLGLGSDNLEAIEYVSKLGNLYGDTTWVSHKKILKAIEVCGSEKILFGSDAPINLDKTYEFYKELFERNGINTEDYENIMYKNAIKLFKLNFK